ncbi:MAG: hypothetical protein V3V12_01250 [Gammaproteobacteria bacterium]
MNELELLDELNIPYDLPAGAMLDALQEAEIPGIHKEAASSLKQHLIDVLADSDQLLCPVSRTIKMAG